ncbi:MAG: protein-glutamate O-methyltransferase CheR [Hyphomonadaceae bacterium]
MLTEAEFALIAREVKDRAGLALRRDAQPSLEARLTPLQRRESMASASELVLAARKEPHLWAAITDALMIADTRFFRDRAFFSALRSALLPALLEQRGGQRLRIWSAGCATGQEAYSLAILMEEMRAQGLAGGDILATDYCERLLDKARAGLYTQFEVQRGLPIRTLIAHFEKAGELWRTHESLRATIQFERRNLLEAQPGLGPFDLVLCRHVLSHLDPEARRAALEAIAAALAPEGVLALGEGETLDGAHDAFMLVEAGMYRRDAAWRQAAA